MLKWNTKIKASIDQDFADKLIINGVLIDSTVNKNGWQILEEDLEDIASQSVGVQLRVDHSDDVRDVKGKILNTEVDQPHDEDKAEWDPANENVHIHFTAELVTTDIDILVPVKHGYVDHVSIGADAENVFCSECGKPTRPIKVCRCTGHEILKGIIVKEYSIVTTPAYDSAVFVPFTAAVDKFLEGDNIPEEKEITNESGTKFTSENITINYYYPKETPTFSVDATSNTTTDTVVSIEPEEKIEVVASEEKEMIMRDGDNPCPAEACNQPDPNEFPSDFVVNVSKDKIEDPGLKEKMKASEETNMTDNEVVEKEAGKEEQEEYQASEVAQLIAAVNELVASLTAIKAEATKEEDEEKEVKASEGYVTEDHDPAHGNPPSPSGAKPAPVDPNPLPKTEVTDKIPVKTPAMSAGQSAGLLYQANVAKDVEDKSMDEIFSFAAKKLGWNPKY